MTNIPQQIRHIIKSCKNSIAGLKTAFNDELAFRQDLLIFTLGIILIISLPLPFMAKLLLFFSLVLILVAELTNTAIENTIDRISTKWHELSKKAKDLGSAVVFVALMNALVIWSAVIIKYILL